MTNAMALRTILRYERERYFGKSNVFSIGGGYTVLKEALLNSNRWKIWQWQKELRKEEFYRSAGKRRGAAFLLEALHRRRKNRLGRSLGFDIPAGVFAPGLLIWHPSPIAVNPCASVGRDAVIVGNLCIGNTGGSQEAPSVGDNCTFGWGSAVIGAVTMGSDCKIGAGAVVLRGAYGDGATLIGTPARNHAARGSESPAATESGDL